MTTKRTLIVAVLAVAVIGLLACQPNPPDMPNPASAYCEEQGYTLEIRKDAEGNEYGVCLFPDGTECEEWAFYRGECKPGGEAIGGAVGLPNPASAYCAGLGYTLEMREGEGGQYGVCRFPDETECEEWAFFRAECGQTWSYCAQQGYTLERREITEGESTSVYAECVFPDGSTCPELDYFNGDCTYEP